MSTAMRVSHDLAGDVETVYALLSSSSRPTPSCRPRTGHPRQDIVAEVKVSIPLVGGRLEKFAVDSGKSVLADEAAFTNAALTSH
jgi:hypothetical protein